MSDTTRQATLKEVIVRLMARCGTLDSWKKNEKPELSDAIVELSNLLDGPFTTVEAIRVAKQIGVALVFLLCLCLPAFAQLEAKKKSVGSLDGVAIAPTYLVNQNFEGTGYDNGETWTESGTGIVNEDYTGVVLEGAQSLRISMASQNCKTITEFAAQDEVWVYFLLHPVALRPSDNTYVMWMNTNQSLANLVVDGTGQLVANSDHSTNTISTVTNGGTYHVWYHYKKGSGGDAVFGVAFSIDGTRPTSGNNFAEYTTSARTSQVTALELGDFPTGNNATYELIFDKVRVSASQIGDNPP